MNTQSIDCRKVEYGRPGGTPDQPGDFCWSPKGEDSDGRRYLYLCLPGDTSMSAMRCFHGPDRGIAREWSWDGNEDQPTLKPSINWEGHWHGYLTAGRLVSC